MDKKIIFFDLDGTIVDHKTHSIPKSTIEAIKLVKDRGIKVFIATGRVPALFYGMDKKVGIKNYVAANGKYVVIDGEVVVNMPLDKKIIKHLIEESTKQGYDIGFQGVNEYVVNRVTNDLYKKFGAGFDLQEPIIDSEYYKTHDVYQCILYTNDDNYKKFTHKFPELTFNYSNPWGVDVNAIGGMKDLGIKEVLNYYGYSIEESVAIGDGYNDIGMIKYVGLGIVMGNACDELKEVADYITTNVDDNGVYNALKKFNLI